MSKQELVIIAVGTVVFLCALPYMKKMSIKNARKAESEGRFSDAYQLYAKIVFTATNSFSLPPPKQFKSAKDFQEWITDSASAYTKYLLEKPQRSDLGEAVEKLQSIACHLTYIENKLELQRSEKITAEEYVDFFHSMYFQDQREVPAQTRKDATELYNRNISIVAIEGDSSSHVEGCFYNVERNVSTKYSIGPDPGAGVVVFLASGQWVAVSRIVPALSNPKDKAWREVRDIRGRYAATFLSVPNESHVTKLNFEPRNAKGWPAPGLDDTRLS